MTTKATRLLAAQMVTDGGDNLIYCESCLEASPEQLDSIGPVFLIDRFPRAVERAPKLPSCSGCGQPFQAAP